MKRWLPEDSLGLRVQMGVVRHAQCTVGSHQLSQGKEKTLSEVPGGSGGLDEEWPGAHCHQGRTLRCGRSRAEAAQGVSPHWESLADASHQPPPT